MTVAVKLTLTTTPPAGTAFQNGGFENGSAPWVFTDEAQYATNDGLARSGVGYALLAPQGLSSTVYQQITVPCTGGGSTLRFYLNVSSSIATQTMVDRLFVEVTSPTNAIQQILGSFSNLDRASPGVYTLRGPFALSAFACQTVRLRFLAVPGASFGGATSFRVDDVSLQ